MCVSCCYNIFPAEDPGEDILDGWEAGRGHHRRINLPVGAGGVFKKRKCYSKKIVHKYLKNGINHVTITGILATPVATLQHSSYSNFDYVYLYNIGI